MPSTKVLWFLHLLLLIWLLAWVSLTWGAVQDDAFIHFRYANNLRLHSFITYDGVHADYGTSSLLYVAILAMLRGLTESPQLPRATSSVVHLLLFSGLAAALARFVPRRAQAARLAGAVLLAMLVLPSAVRWLDDGMETGLVVSVSAMLAWMIYGRLSRAETSVWKNVLLGLAASAAVLLRTEMLLLCGVGFLILLLERARRRQDAGMLSGPVIAIAVGAAGAVAVILGTMPDTAIAKSHGIGHWFNPIHDLAVTLAGAFSFGAGMLAFWLLTLGLVVMRRGVTVRMALANSLCPVLLVLSSLRGQEMQGVRYFAWTFVFSILWNIQELAAMTDETFFWNLADSRGTVLLCVFLGLVAVELPYESLAMHRVLSGRGAIARVFASQHLEVLRGRQGVASDIGYIGYFTGARICDLAGLVNGRPAATMSSAERVRACAQTDPDFMFLSQGQLGTMTEAANLSSWQICGRYDFPNVRRPDVHYLLVKPALAAEVCQATGRVPVAADSLSDREWVARCAGPEEGEGCGVARGQKTH